MLGYFLEYFRNAAYEVLRNLTVICMNIKLSNRDSFIHCEVVYLSVSCRISHFLHGHLWCANFNFVVLLLAIKCRMLMSHVAGLPMFGS